jgi:tetratricopeptide (TPR) repeat protein
MKRVLAAGLFTVLLTGCGDSVLWSRWQAERATFHALRAAGRVEARGRTATTDERVVAEARLEAIEAAFPATRWGEPPARGPARDVALASARAAIAHARLASSAGDDALALQRWRQALARWGALPRVTIAARAGAARALERLSRFEDALDERRALALMDPLGDPDRTGPSPQVLDAPAAVARELRETGRKSEAEVVLATADTNFSRALSRSRGADKLAMAGALADIRVLRGNAAGALEALRSTLDGLRAWEVPSRVVMLAECAFEAGENDSAIAYARWAASTSISRSVAGPALVLAARAWEAKGQMDSAFAAYHAVFERWADPGLIAPEAHFRRACLLERLGTWESAKSEFASLAAAAPTHPYAFQAILRVVRHHIRAGDIALARIEGGNAIERLEYLLATNRDPQLQLHAGLTRADLLLDLGHSAPAESSLVDLWRRFPEDSAAESAALRGAALAERRPGGRAEAAAIYVELARHAESPPVRRAAAERRTALALAAPSVPGERRR